jgi:hypothetical protein
MGGSLGGRRCWRGRLAGLTAGVVFGLVGCGGGGGGGGGTSTRAPLPDQSEDTFPAGARIDVASRDFHPVTLGDTLTFHATDTSGDRVEVHREVTSGPDAQGHYTFVETVPAQPALPALTSTFRLTPEGVVAVNYRHSDRLPGPVVPIGDFLLYPTPYYPVGATRTAVRQGSLGADVDGDGVHDSFRFEFSQVLVGFEDGERGDRLEVRARFRQHIVVRIHPSRLDWQPYRLSDMTEEVWFGAHTGLIQSARAELMVPATFGRSYDDLHLVDGLVGGRSVETAWNAGTTRYIPLDVLTVVYEPVGGYYYAGLKSGASANPGTVARIDPTSGDVAYSIPLGGDVRSVGVSSDGTSLYAGIVGRNEVVRLSLPGLQVQERIPLPAGSWVYALAVSPVDASTFAWFAEGTISGGPYLVRAGVQQVQSPGILTPAASSGALTFSADGAHLLMISETSRRLTRMAVLPDGISGMLTIVTDPIYGNALTAVGSDVLAGNSLFRVSDLSRVAGASATDAVACTPLRASTRWACEAGLSTGYVVTVVDTSDSYALVEDGNVPLGRPMPAGIGSRRGPVPGPHGQVAMILTASVQGGWLVLFDNPDFR